MKLAKFESEIGTLHITVKDSVTKIYLPNTTPSDDQAYQTVLDPSFDPSFSEVCTMLTNYFNGQPIDTNLIEPLIPKANEFRYKVWKACSEIPYGSTISYGALARRAGYPRAARAVGSAMAKNPLPLLVPCHRVVAADGSLAGYGGGEDMKRWLLLREGVNLR